MSSFNRLIWTITDGSQGMISQTNGLAKELSNNFTELKTDVFFPWSKLQPGFLPVYKWIFKNKFNFSKKPNIIITCGRKSVYASLYLKKIFKKNIITIHIQNPKINSKNFDFVIAPNHDNYKNSNVINTTGAIHHFTKKNIEKNNDKLDFTYNNKLVSIIIGGSNRHYIFTKTEVQNLILQIKKIKSNYKDINLCIIPSRRTDNDTIDLLIKDLGNIAYVWNKNGTNPYIYCLKHSDYFIITSDSTSMISECAFTGKPIYIFHLPFKRNSKRFYNFHNEFEKKGITRKMGNVLENWNYNILNEAERIASILETRILKR